MSTIRTLFANFIGSHTIAGDFGISHHFQAAQGLCLQGYFDWNNKFIEAKLGNIFHVARCLTANADAAGAVQKLRYSYGIYPKPEEVTQVENLYQISDKDTIAWACGKMKQEYRDFLIHEKSESQFSQNVRAWLDSGKVTILDRLLYLCNLSEKERRCLGQKLPGKIE